MVRLVGYSRVSTSTVCVAIISLLFLLCVNCDVTNVESPLSDASLSRLRASDTQPAGFRQSQQPLGSSVSREIVKSRPNQPSDIATCEGYHCKLGSLKDNSSAILCPGDCNDVLCCTGLNVIADGKEVVDGLTNSTNTIIAEIVDKWETVSQKIGVAILLIIGSILLILGYRLFRVTIFCAAFAFAGGICYFFLHKYQSDKLDFKSQLFISLAVGLVAGGLAMFILKVGFFLAGAVLGFFLSTFAFTIVVPYQGSPHSLIMLLSAPWQYYVIIGICALITGMLATTNRFQKLVIILGTSLAGGFCIMAFIDYFAETGFSEAMRQVVISAKDGGSISVYPVKDWAWALIAGWALLTALGTLLQYKKFGKTMCCAPRGHEESKNPDFKPYQV